MGKGKANKTAPKPVVVVEASAAATAKREGNTVMTSFFHPAAAEKRRGRKKKAKTEAGRPAKKKSEKEVQAGKEKLKTDAALKGEAIEKLKTEKLAQPRVSFVTDKIAHEVARSCIEAWEKKTAHQRQRKGEKVAHAR